MKENEEKTESEKNRTDDEADFSVEISRGAFDRPQEYVGLPDGCEVVFCCDEYCPKKFTDVAFSTYRMRKIVTPVEVKATDGELAVVAAGGKDATVLAKKVAAKTGLPLVIFAFDAGFCGYGDRKTETTDKYGETRSFTVKNKMKIVFDPGVSSDPDRVAAGYGAICSALVFLFEKEVRSLLCDEKYDRIAAAKVLRAIAGTIKAETVSSGAAVVCGLAALTKTFCGERFLGGESVAKVARLIGKTKSSEENAAFFACETMAVYRAVMRCVSPAVVVPDVNARLDYMSKKFGISPVILTKNLGAYRSADEVARKIYCVREFLPELDLKAAAYLKILGFAAKRFKRLYKDRGFSYNGYARAEEKKICFALAPEIGMPFTLLDLARQTGLSDALLQRTKNGQSAQKNQTLSS